MLRRIMRWQLDERGAEPLSQSEQPLDEIIRWSFAVFEAPKVGDNLREFGAKSEVLRGAFCPSSHFFRSVNSVMRGVEFNGPELLAVGLWEKATRCFVGIGGPDPFWNVPGGSAQPYFASAIALGME